MIDRRTLLQAAPLAALATCSTASAIGADPHRAWANEHKEMFDRLFAPSAPDLDSDNPDWVRCKEIERRICTVPATTPDGAAAQLEFAMSNEANFDLTGGVAGDLDGQVLRNVLATLKSLT
ncbi:hypothetical protein J7394_00105 [Ruegeria sp. R13_0]|uniref:hypothetical protein n=1 Tax=Ruegeria sp. R13_0 TaxID=2821099 RepID=UPI001ADA1513|nr:hypothetical protein [Ruegeria sp. R13_0]MBO9432586.1 hypothetical protein [Ruegeria sp. R13_0]